MGVIQKRYRTLILTIASPTLLGWLIYLVSSWIDSRDHFDFESMLSGRGHPSTWAELFHNLGPIPLLISGASLGVFLGLWQSSRSKSIFRKVLICFPLLILAGVGGIIICHKVTYEPPKVTWVDPSKKEPEGSTYMTFSSETIGGPVSYLIYLPEEYFGMPEKRYPVVYCLPGSSGSQAKVGGFIAKLKRLKVEGVVPMIVVGVNGIAGSGYRDPPEGHAPIESVIIKDLIPHIDATYRTDSRREARGLEGFSMGGFGALYLGMKYPERFGVVLSQAPGGLSRGGIGSPWNLAKDNADRIRGKTRMRLVCGTEDHFVRSTAAYRAFLNSLSIPSDFIEVKGAGHWDLVAKVEDRQVLGVFDEAFR